MKHVIYDGKAFLTTDEVADTLMSLTSQLGSVHRSNIVELPTFDEAGRESSIQIIVSASSQMSTVPAASTEPDPDTNSAATRLRDQVTAVHPRGLSFDDDPATIHPGNPDTI